MEIGTKETKARGAEEPKSARELMKGVCLPSVHGDQVLPASHLVRQSLFKFFPRLDICD